MPFQGLSPSFVSLAGLKLTLLHYQLKLTDPKSPIIPHATLRQAMLATIGLLNKYTSEVGATEPSLMNFCVTDGVSVVATRYISSRTEEAASLFFSTGSSFEEYAEGGHFRMNKADRRENIILVA